MRKLLIGLSLVSSVAIAADLTDVMNTPSNRQVYNQSFRDTKDGNNAMTTDGVSANSYAFVTTASTFVVKTSGGYLDNVTLGSICNGTTTYIIADSSFGAVNYATVISTIGTNTQAINLPFHVRFLNGLAVNIVQSSCPVTVSYR